MHMYTIYHKPFICEDGGETVLSGKEEKADGAEEEGRPVIP